MRVHCPSCDGGNVSIRPLPPEHEFLHACFNPPEVDNTIDLVEGKSTIVRLYG